MSLLKPNDVALNSNSHTHKDLFAWQHTLDNQLAGGDILLGQLPHGQQPYDIDVLEELAVLLQQVFARYSFHDALQVVEKSYPLPYALFIVLQGIYHYNRGEFWPLVGLALGISDTYQFSNPCGQLFRRILCKYNLPTFEQIPGLTNLTPILAHGGIPNYSLGDFFKLLHRSIRRKALILDAPSLIAEWRISPEDTFFFIDKPVQNFTLHGGNVAEDFITRCLELALAERDADLSVLDLPQRVVDAFQDWKREQGFSRSHQHRIRITHPKLYLDPYADGVCLELPPQKVAVGNMSVNLVWHVVWGNESHEFVTYREWDGANYAYVVNEVVTVAPSDCYDVTLSNGKDTLYEWKINGLPDDQIMSFDRYTADIQDEHVRLHPGEKWLLFPSSCRLEIQGGQKSEDCPQQPGHWGNYSIQGWHVAPDGLIQLKQGSHTLSKLKILSSQALERPILVGGKQPIQHVLSNRIPLYCGSPPSIRINLASTSSSQLARWRIQITSEGPSSLKAPIDIPLVEMQHVLDVSAGIAIDLPLSASKLLGEQACGTFAIRVRGPYGRGRKFSVRIVPHLHVTGHEDVDIKPSSTPPELLLECRTEDRLFCLNQELAHIERVGEGLYQVNVRPETSQVNFSYRHQDGFHVPFSIQIRRLRWGLKEPEQALIWRTSILKLHPLQLTDINNTSLFIDIPTRSGQEKIHSGWRIVDSNNKVLKSVEPNQDEIIQQFSLPITEMMPYFRLAQEHGELLWLQLVVAEADNPAEAFDIMQLLPELDLGDTLAELRTGQDSVAVDICWQNHIRSPQLHLCLWPADQPWLRTPVAKPIADTENGQATVTLKVAELPGELGYRGAYIGQLTIVDLWLATLPERPTTASNVLQLESAATCQYYEALADKVAANESSVLELLTLLAFYGREKEKAKWHDTNELLYKLASSGDLTVTHLLTWLELVHTDGSTSAYKRLAWMIFDAQYLAGIAFDQLGYSERAVFVEHFPGNKPSPHKEHLIWLLDHNIGELRSECIVELCEAGHERGFQELLDEFAVGLASDHLIVTAATSEQLALANFLLSNRTQPAAMLLRTLVDLGELSPFWLQEGVVIHMDRGSGLVTAITDRENGEILPCCLPNEDCQVEVELELGNEIVLVSLFPADQRILLHTTSELRACSLCGQLGFSDQAILSHYDEVHPEAGQRGIKPVPPGRTIRYMIHSIAAPSRENL